MCDGDSHPLMGMGTPLIRGQRPENRQVSRYGGGEMTEPPEVSCFVSNEVWSSAEGESVVMVEKTRPETEG